MHTYKVRYFDRILRETFDYVEASSACEAARRVASKFDCRAVIVTERAN